MRAYEKLKKFMKEVAEVPELEPPPEPVTQPSDTESTPESLCFELNANRSDDRQPIGPGTLEPGCGVTCVSPLFGEFDAMVIRDLGNCVWVWHPIRECEACIPRSWLTGIIIEESKS